LPGLNQLLKRIGIRTAFGEGNGVDLWFIEREGIDCPEISG
jgi:hypothetical protein